MLNNSHHVEHRDRQYFDRYELAVRFYLQDISALRGTLDHAVISKRLLHRRRWRELDRPYSDLVDRGPTITGEVEQRLLDFATLMRGISVDYRLVVSSNNGYVYTNDAGLISTIEQLPYLAQMGCYRAVVTRPRDAVQLQRPRHQLRTYFNSVEMTEDTKDNLVLFLQAQPDIRLSPGLVKWFGRDYLRTLEYFFVDHNEPSLLTMMNLIRPGLTRKTMPIIAADK